MNLKEIIRDLNILNIKGSLDKDILNISYNSKKITENSLFIAISGFKKDGHDFIIDAINNGATSIIVQKEDVLNKISLNQNVTLITVPDTRIALAKVSDNFYKHPSSKLTLIGVTGTNGKTTTTFLTDRILKCSNKKTSFITTIESFILDKKILFDRTTPESLDLNSFFYESLNSKVKFSTMEVSSHAIDLHRIDFLNYDYFIFTNLTQDHLDYHKNMQNYFNTKKKLFIKEYRNLYSGKGAVINNDDLYGKQLIKETDLETISYSINDKNSDIFAQNIINNTNGIEMDVLVKKLGNIHIKSNLMGYFNVYNILAAIGVSVFLNIDPLFIQEGIKQMTGVNGRFEKIQEIKDFTVIVDYAHTPDGLENILKTASSILNKDSKIITVFGCGGDRDKTKRKIMGKIAGDISDFVIITSDNPRTEDPQSIIEMIEEGLKESGNKNYLKIVDRETAINNALNMANKDDIVIIAGKGHENYQEFKDKRIYFSDQQVVKNWINNS